VKPVHTTTFLSVFWSASAALGSAAALVFLAAGCGGGEESTDPVIEEIVRLEKKGDVDALAEKTRDPEPRVSRLAVHSLARIGRKAKPVLDRAIRDERPEVRAEAVLVYPRVAKRSEAAEPLAQIARSDPQPQVRAAAVTALGQMRAFDKMDALFEALDDPDPLVRRRAAGAVSRILGRTYELYVDGPAEKRRQAIAELRKVWPELAPQIRDYYTRPFKNKK